jgi:hypothetical protein
MKKLHIGRIITTTMLALLILFGFIQLIPIGRNHTNPPVKYTQTWDSPVTEELVRGACYDCHSNETHWPWYTYVAPASWLVSLDVTEGRQQFNFSEASPDEVRNYLPEMIEVIRENAMPPIQYQVIHAEARFSAKERQELINGLSNTYKQ